MYTFDSMFYEFWRTYLNAHLPRTHVAVMIMAYALYTFHWRANSIRKGGRGPYDDRLGPVSYLSVSLASNYHIEKIVVDTSMCCIARYVYCHLYLTDA